MLAETTLLFRGFADEADALTAMGLKLERPLTGLHGLSHARLRLPADALALLLN
jgi:hypothetical protein